MTAPTTTPPLDDALLDRLRTAPVLGFTGKAGSGKSAAAAHLFSTQANIMRIAFARALKAMVKALITNTKPLADKTTPITFIEHPKRKEEPVEFLAGFTPRFLMQTLGTEWGRKAVHPDFWVAIVARKVSQQLSAPTRRTKRPHVIIDDLRFENEAEMVRGFDGMVIRVVRPGHDKPAAVDAHDSERLDFDADLTIINSGTLDEFEALLDRIWPMTRPTKGARVPPDKRL